jgi:chemotaxis protein histidine kinase CheA
VTEDAELLRVLADLRTQYLAEAPERLSTLRNALQCACAGDAEGLPELRLLLHRLAGSGGSYGLQAVTEAARAAEHEVYALQDSPPPLTAGDAAHLSDLIEEVAAAFREAGAAV